MLAKFSVKKPFTVLVIVILIIVFGAVSFTKMTPDLFPSINMPYAMVMTTDTGASPEEVESEVTKPLEQQMATLNHIKNVTSKSSENYSLVMLEFSDDVNMDAISVDIREKIDLISGNWDETVGTPVVMKMNPDMMPVNIAAVNLQQKSAAETSRFVEENLLSPLEGIEGVASVNATGLVSEDIQVVLSQDKIDQINEETSDAVLSQFSSAKNKLKSGINSAENGQNQIESGKQQLTAAQQKTAEQLEAARLKMQDGKKQLQQLKSTVNEMTILKSSLEQIEAQVRAQNPSLTDQQVKELCMNNPIYAQSAAAMEAMNQAIAQAGMSSENLPTSREIDGQIAALDKSLSQLNIQQATAFSAMGNQMSEITSSGSTLQSTVMQLQSSLKQVQSSEEAALASANLTGVLTMSNVSSILNAQNFSMPAGYVSDGKNEVLVNVGDKISGTKELKDLTVLDMNIDNVDPVKLSDIADIKKTDNTEDTYAKINDKNGVLLAFSKQSGYSTAEVADRVNEKFASLSEKYPQLEFTSLSDQGEYIHLVVDSVLNNLIIGAILAIIILLLFLRDIRPTIITAVSIPISVTFAIALMYFSGVTLNVMSLSGLAVGVGMLVDNSIVVIENIYRLRAMGFSHTKAAISGAAQVTGAITASTLTTICVFVPIVFVEGMTRQIFMDLALTIAYSLLASLFIALTLVPAMARGLLVRDAKKTALSQDSRAILSYKKLVSFTLHHRVWVLLTVIVLLVGTAGLTIIKGFSYMPAMTSPQISVTIQMPKESQLNETADVTDKVSKEILKNDSVDTVGAMLASDANSAVGMSTGEKDVTQMMLYVILNEDKLEESGNLSKKIEALGEKYNCEITAVGETDMMSSMGGAGIQAEIYCDDLTNLRKAAIQLEKQMGGMKEIDEVTNTLEDSTPELKVSINKNKAMTHGLTVAQVFASISEDLKKDQSATELVQNNDNVNVVVSNQKSNSLSKSDIENMKVIAKQPDGTQKTVRLSKIATISEGQTLSAIDHDAQKRKLTVSATLKEGYNITIVNNKVEKMVDTMNLPAGVKVEFGGETENIMDAMGQLVLMMGLGLLMVYLVMVAQFQSLRSPFIVMFTVPLAFTGGLLGLLLTGNDISVVSMIGFVMLVGIIVNNAIVLVDCINQFRLEGMERKEAIISAGAIRMRPVLMTAITTVLGLLPMAIGVGSGAEMMQPVAIVCIGGLIYGTLMTLIVIPIMYSFLSKKHMVKISEDELTIVDA